ncbi:MAG: hypothetical protein J1F65_02605 [Clostridiales bacterium]|nr:hypothetical protein [Clostridiales bacterium]
MKGLRVVGDYALEFLVITLLVALSAVTILPFIPILVGVTAFFGQDMGTRRFKDIFTAIGANWKILIFYTLFQLVMIVVPTLNIYFFNVHTEQMSYFVLAVSYVALVVGVIYLTTAPTIIVNMKVSFFQLLRNGIMLVFGSWWRSILSIGIVAGIVAMIIYYPYPIVLTLYAVPLINAKLMKENFYHLKAKALGTTVYELKKKLKEDDYLDEKGQIKPYDDNGEVK